LTPEAWVARWASGDSACSRFFEDAPYSLDGGARRRDASKWQPFSPSEIDEWKLWLRAHGAGAEVLARVDAFAQPDALCVAGGQQAGFALGPLLVLTKALSIAEWARRVEVQSGRACVPVFWVASDDHDLAEVSGTSWLDSNGALLRDRIALDRASAPAHDTRIPPAEAARIAEAMATSLPESQGARLKEVLADACADGATFESAFTRLFLVVTEGTQRIGPGSAVSVMPDKPAVADKKG